MRNLRNLLVAVFATAFIPVPALACGGFFCSQAQPVDQSGERILFAVDGTNVTAHIQIQYVGPSEEFSWALPSVPQLRVGTDQTFNALLQATGPQFNINWQHTEDCKVPGCDADFGVGGGSDGGDMWMNAPASEEAGGGSVQVVAAGNVGPYDYKVIEAVDGADGEAVFEWLNDNGYDQPEGSQDIINQYVNTDFVFLALKLSKREDVGSIRPVVVEYEAPMFACVPLKLTSIAAAPNMPIFVWVLAQSRAVPMNYFHVKLNPAAYPWTECGRAQGATPGCSWMQSQPASCSTAYRDLITMAVDEAEGKAFVTEYAGSTQPMKNRVWGGTDDANTIVPTHFSAWEAAQQLTSTFGFIAGDDVRSILEQFIAYPGDDAFAAMAENEGEYWLDYCGDEENFYVETWCMHVLPEDYPFDRDGMVAAIQERIIDPLVEANELFDQFPYITRLATTMSAEDMTLDPLFSFNPDLPDVTNTHDVTANAICAGKQAVGARITFADASFIEFEGTFDNDGFTPDDSPTSDQPAAGSVEIMGEEGDPETVAEADIPGLGELIALRTPTPGAGDTPQRERAVSEGTFSTPNPGNQIGESVDRTPRTRDTGFFGCTSVPSSTGAPVTGLLLLLGLAAVLRRRLSA